MDYALIASLLPHALVLLYVGVSVVMSYVRHGYYDTKPYNGWLGFIDAVILLSLLYWGGFFHSRLAGF